MRASSPTVEDIAVRQQLSSLRSLIALSGLLTNLQDEGEILHIVASTVSSLGRCRTEAILVDGAICEAAPGSGEWPRALVAEILSASAIGGGPVALPGRAWTWAYPFSSPAGPTGRLIVSADSQPHAEGALLLEVLAQMAGSALANARLHTRERAQAEELRKANVALERTATIHQRFTQVAAGGQGREGIARAVYDLTGLRTEIEDRHGNLLAWAGPVRGTPRPNESESERARLFEIDLESNGPFRFNGRLVSVARPSSTLLGVIALVDPMETAGEADRMALEHATTVFALELSRLQSLLQSDEKLRAELVIELVGGTKGPGALGRAQALDYELHRPHWVVMIEGNHGTGDADAFADVVRRTARATGAGSLLATRPKGVVALADHEVAWDAFRSAVMAELHGGRCRIGVGSRCDGLDDYPRSYAAAQQALKLQVSLGGNDRVTIFEELGIYQILSDVPDLDRVERLVRRWLGRLLDYDEQNGAQLVSTVSAYLECGGNYDQTAKMLFVHRSTLKYRLGRIREISGLDLSSADARFNLQLATRAWRTLLALRGS